MSIAVYTTPTCTLCPGEIRRLRDRGIEPEVIDVTCDQQAYELITGLGYTGVPVTIRRDDQGQIIDHWQGFRPDKLLELTRALARS